jgi:hypothetical protein
VTTPLGQARLDLIAARADLAAKDTPSHRKAVEDALATLDTLLDSYPLPPTAQELIPPGPSVSFPSIPPHVAEELMAGEQ